MTIGEHIQRLRTARGWSREELARRITCDDRFNPLGTRNRDGSPSMKRPTKESVRKWEEGIIIPNPDALLALAYALRGNPESLYNYWKEKRDAEYKERSKRRRECPLCQTCPYRGTLCRTARRHVREHEKAPGGPGAVYS